MSTSTSAIQVDPRALISALEVGDVSFLVDAINRVDDAALWNAKLLNHPEKLSVHQCMSYYFAILTCYSAGPDTASDKAQRRRKVALDKLVLMLKKGRLPDLHGRQLVDKLFAQLRLLNDVNASSLAERIMDDFTPQGPVELAGHSKALEVLGHLVVRAGSDRRKHLVSRLCEAKWVPSTVVMLASALVEIVETEEECQRALKKIGAYAAWGGFNGAETHEDGDVYGDARYVDIEELPALLYQLTGLTRKCEGTSATVKGQVLETIAASLDRLLWAGAPSAPGHEALSPSEKARVDAVLATTVHHLSLLVAKDQGFAAEIVSLIKARRLSAAPGAAAAAAPTGLSDPSQAAASPSRLLLALLAARAPRQEAKIVAALCEAVFELHTMQVGPSVGGAAARHVIADKLGLCWGACYVYG